MVVTVNIVYTGSALYRVRASMRGIATVVNKVYIVNFVYILLASESCGHVIGQGRKHKLSIVYRIYCKILKHLKL